MPSNIIFPKRKYKKILPKKRVIPPRRLKKMVKQIVQEDEETKQISQQITPTSGTFTSFNSGISASNECYSVLPDLYKGTSSNARIGDKIKPMFVKLRWNMSITGGVPLHVYLFVLEDKNQKDGNQARESQFLNDSGSGAYFDGTLRNSCLPVDTERFRVIKRQRIRLAATQYPSGTGTAITDASGQYFKEFQVKINMKRYGQIDYSGGNGQPINRNLYWCLGYTKGDGSTESLTTSLNAMCLTTFYFKDA